MPTETKNEDKWHLSVLRKQIIVITSNSTCILKQCPLHDFFNDLLRLLEKMYFQDQRIESEAKESVRRLTIVQILKN